MKLRSCFRLYLYCFLTFSTLACQSKVPAQVSPSTSTSVTNMNDLRTRILDIDYTVQATVKELGETAMPVLVPLVTHEDPAVRELVLICMDLVGNMNAYKYLFRALYDEDTQVQAVSIRSLRKQTPPDSLYKALIQILNTHSEPHIRGEIALVIGKMPNVAQIDDLTPAVQRETDPETNDAFLAALSRLGLPQVQQRFSERLSKAQGDDLKRFLEHSTYIGQPWLIKPLATHLDNEEPMIWIGIDADPSAPKNLRACDRVAKMIVVLSRQPFRFMRTSPDPINYTPEQRQEIKEYVERLR